MIRADAEELNVSLLCERIICSPSRMVFRFNLKKWNRNLGEGGKYRELLLAE